MAAYLDETSDDSDMSFPLPVSIFLRAGAPDRGEAGLEEAQCS